MPSLRFCILQDIQGDGILYIPWIEVDHVVYAVFRYVVQYYRCQVAVGIHHSQSLAGEYIREYYVQEQGGLPCAGLSYDIRVIAPILPLYTEGFIPSSEVSFGKECYV